MGMAEKVGWLLAVVLCVLLPALLGYWKLAVVGALLLALTWWLLARKAGM